MLLKHLIATTALSLALAAPAISFAADPAPFAPAANSATIKTDALIKASLKTPSGDRIGEVEGVLLDKAGKSQAVVVDVGGFLGMGEHRVALAWNDLTITKNGDQVTTRFTKEQLKAMPTYKYPDTKNRLTAFYDPAWEPGTIANRTIDRMTAEDWHPLSSAMKMSKILDANIRGPANETVGEIEDALVDRGGKISAVVVDVGGFLGVGNKHVALDFEKLQPSQSGDSLRFMTSMTKDQLKALPEFTDRMASNTSATTKAGGIATDPKKY